MRNYDRYKIGEREFRGKIQAASENSDYEKKRNLFRENKKLVVEENTIYEIDLDCMECLDKNICK